MIRLVTPDPSMLDAAEGFTEFPGALRAIRDAAGTGSESARWGVRLFMLHDPPTLVGWGGFKGPPRDGTVELGYEIAAAWRGRGLATAAVHALLDEAFAAPEVQTVLAHTLPERNASVRVLEKAGFAREGEVPDQEVGTAWRFSSRRSTAPSPGRARTSGS